MTFSARNKEEAVAKLRDMIALSNAIFQQHLQTLPTGGDALIVVAALLATAFANTDAGKSRADLGVVADRVVNIAFSIYDEMQEPHH